MFSSEIFGNELTYKTSLGAILSFDMTNVVLAFGERNRDREVSL